MRGQADKHRLAVWDLRWIYASSSAGTATEVFRVKIEMGVMKGNEVISKGRRGGVVFNGKWIAVMYCGGMGV